MRVFSYIILVATLCFLGCVPGEDYVPKSSSGIPQADLDIPAQKSGHSLEQDNIRRRSKLDNTPGLVKHLYLISPLTGKAFAHSTVDGKVTSSTKRLSPHVVAAQDGEFVDDAQNGLWTKIGTAWYRTPEVMQEDGTYGEPAEFIYWFDSKGNYHRIHISGCVLYISEKPLKAQDEMIELDEVEASLPEVEEKVIK